MRLTLEEALAINQVLSGPLPLYPDKADVALRMLAIDTVHCHVKELQKRCRGQMPLPDPPADK